MKTQRIIFNLTLKNFAENYSAVMTSKKEERTSRLSSIPAFAKTESQIVP